MELLAWVLAGLAGAICLAAFILFRLYAGTVNTLVALDQRCDTAFADIDVHLKHRHNLVPGLVAVVKGATTHEKEIVLGIAEARAKAIGAALPNVRLEAEGNLTAQIGSLLAAAEKYPELRAMPEFTQLRQQLIDCENRITAARRFYNLAIEEFNTAVRQFPGSLIADRRQLSVRRPFDLGIERVLVDDALTIAL